MMKFLLRVKDVKKLAKLIYSQRGAVLERMELTSIFHDKVSSALLRDRLSITTLTLTNISASV